MGEGFGGKLEMVGYIILIGGSLISRRILFAAIAATAMLCFSECAYWYTKGFHEILIYERTLVYLYPAFFCMWAIQAFNVRRLAPLFLCAAIYGLIVEGGIVWIIFESGDWKPISITNTPINWHAPISVIFGWWFLRKALLAEGRKGWVMLAVGAIAFGVFWGVWSTYHWLPDTIQEFGQDEDAAFIGQIPVWKFGLYTLLITAIVTVMHWLMGSGKRAGGAEEAPPDQQRMFPTFSLLPRYWQGRGVWLPEFKPHFLECVIMIAWLWVWHVTFCLPNALKTIEAVDGDPSSVGKLPVAIAVILIALWANRAQESKPNVYEQLRGPLRYPRLLALLILMPLAATLAYGVCVALDPSHAFIEKYLYIGIVTVTIYAGFWLFVVSLILCFLPPYYWIGGRSRMSP